MISVNNIRLHSVKTLSSLLSILLLAAVTESSIAAELLRDINPAATPLGSVVPWANDNARIGPVTLFAMNDGAHGNELWRTDGTSAGTFLVKDIYPGPTDSDVAGFTELNGRVVFRANDGVNGAELWTSDGTLAGTNVVANIDGSPFQGALIAYSRPIPRLGNVVIFAASDVGGVELWRSDGTQNGTWRIKDINPGPSSSEPSDFTLLGAQMFFVAEDDSADRELWVTDGTTNGTHLVRDIAPGRASSNPRELTAVNNVLYFNANDGVTGPELWRADASGTSASLVADFVPGVNGTDPRSLIALGDLVIYRGIESPGVPSNVTPVSIGEPFRSDGTASGTFRLHDVYPGSYGSVPENMTRAGSRIVFRVQNVPSGTSSIWGTDGTIAGTQPITTQSLDFDNYRNFVTFGNELLFYGRLGAGSDVAIWRTNGTQAGTSIFAALPPPSFSNDELVVIGTRAYYQTGTWGTVAGSELWTSDGTTTGTRMIVDLNPGVAWSQPSSLFAVNGRLIFLANDGVLGVEPWITDGTANGTQSLGDFNTARLGESGAAHFATLGNIALLLADDGAHGEELWVTDGTSSGTRLLRDIYPGATSSQISSGVVAGGVVYFQADDGVAGKELWRTDGTTGGTFRIADIYSGTVPPPVCQPRTYCPPPDPNPLPASSWAMANGGLALKGNIYFSADDGAHGNELWRTDGTSAGTAMVKDFAVGPQHTWFSFMSVVGNRFFLCVSENSGQRLWLSDGTTLGTTKVTDAVECNPNGAPDSVSHQGILYFPGRSADYDVELWRSDGTAAGTYRVVDLVPGANSSDPMRLSVVGGMVAFGACVSQEDCGFYLTNGSSAGTTKVSGIPRPESPPLLLNGRLYFSGSITGTGTQIYVTDGTSVGTRAFLPASRLPQGIYPYEMVEYSGSLIFTADAGLSGPVAWSSDGTANGTRILFDPPPSTVDSAPAGYFVLGNSLLFSADDATHGRELWIIANGAPTANDDAASTGHNTAARIGVLSNDGFVTSALNPSSVAILSQPLHGIATIDMATGEITYQPENNFSGADNFTYRVRDIANRMSNIGRVKILVGAPAGGAPGVAPVIPPPPPPPSPPAPTAAESGGGNLSLIMLLLLCLVALVRVGLSQNARRSWRGDLRNRI